MSQLTCEILADVLSLCLLLFPFFFHQFLWIVAACMLMLQWRAAFFPGTLSACCFLSFPIHFLVESCCLSVSKKRPALTAVICKFCGKCLQIEKLIDYRLVVDFGFAFWPFLIYISEDKSPFTRYVYCQSWHFQFIWVWEVCFMKIIRCSNVKSTVSDVTVDSFRCLLHRTCTTLVNTSTFGTS